MVILVAAVLVGGATAVDWREREVARSEGEMVVVKAVDRVGGAVAEMVAVEVTVTAEAKVEVRGVRSVGARGAGVMAEAVKVVVVG
jgi:hypothetical protein